MRKATSKLTEGIHMAMDPKVCKLLKKQGKDEDKTPAQIIRDIIQAYFQLKGVL